MSQDFVKKNVDWNVTQAYESRHKIRLKPEYQRNLVWDRDTKQRLIWCMLRGQDIPKIFFHVQGSGNNARYDTIDGQSRLHTIFSFRENAFALSNNAKPIEGKAVAGLRYSELPETLRQAFDDYIIQITEIRCDDIHRVIDQFLDLQRGKRLNGQERRQAPPGFIKDFVFELANHPYVMLSRINSQRQKKFEVIARLLVWELNNSICGTKGQVLDRLYIEHANDTLEMRQWASIYPRMTDIFDELETIFQKHHKGLRSVSMFMLTYWLWRNVRQKYVITVDVESRFVFWSSPLTVLV